MTQVPFMRGFEGEVVVAFDYLRALGYELRDRIPYPHDQRGRVAYQSPTVVVAVEQERHNQLNVRLRLRRAGAPELGLEAFIAAAPKATMFGSPAERPAALRQLAEALRLHGAAALTGDDHAFTDAVERQAQRLAEYWTRMTGRPQSPEYWRKKMEQDATD